MLAMYERNFLEQKPVERVVNTIFSAIHSDFFFFFFLTRTSNFGAQAARSYTFLRFEAENVLKMFLNYI